MAPRVGLAYVLSIHKSQGSEFPSVVIPLHTQHYMMLQRNPRRPPGQDRRGTWGSGLSSAAGRRLNQAMHEHKIKPLPPRRKFYSRLARRIGIVAGIVVFSLVWAVPGIRAS